MPNFVKFQRGSATAYANLQQKDNDTLYFVYDSTNPSAGGLLYLGTVLIGGTGSLLNSVAMSDITDVDLTDIADGALLQYKVTSNKWEAVMPSEVGATGGTATSVDIGTLSEGETVAHAQNRLNSSPNEGDIVIISGEPYVYDGSAWQSLTSSDIASRVSGLETTVGSLSSGVATLTSSVASLTSSVSSLETQMAAVDGKIASAISSANHLTYSVVGSINDVDAAITSGGPELNRTVFLVPNTNNTVGNLYDEYMVVNNNKELLGNFGGADLSGYVTTTGLSSTLANYVTSSALTSALGDYVTTSAFSSAVGTLTSSIEALSSSLSSYVTVSRFESEVGSINTLRTAVNDSSATIVDEIVNIYQMLEWSEINN